MSATLLMLSVTERSHEGLLRYPGALGSRCSHRKIINPTSLRSTFWSTSLHANRGLWTGHFLDLLGHHGCVCGVLRMPTVSILLGQKYSWLLHQSNIVL